MAARRVPLNFFGIALGLAGLAGSWEAMADYGRAPRVVGDVLLGVSSLVWLIVVSAYLRHVASDRSAPGHDLRDPIAAPFAATALLTPILLFAKGVYPHAPVTGRVLVDVFIAVTMLLAAWLTGQWIYAGPVGLDTFHPGYFLPTVGGGMVGSIGAAEVGQPLLAEVMFGLGLISWAVLGPIIMARLMFRPRLPTPLLPSLAIEVAPAGIASLAWFTARGDRIDTVVALLGGYGLMMALAQLRMLPRFLKLPFMPSTWSFAFSWAVVATAALHWFETTRPGGYRVHEYVVLALITALVGGIAARTLVAIGRRELLSMATPALAAVPATAGAVN